MFYPLFDDGNGTPEWWVELHYLKASDRAAVFDELPQHTGPFFELLLKFLNSVLTFQALPSFYDAL